MADRRPSRSERRRKNDAEIVAPPMEPEPLPQQRAVRGGGSGSANMYPPQGPPLPEQQTPRMRTGSGSSVSLSSSSSASYIDISRSWPRKKFGLRAFFTSPSERRVRRRRSKEMFRAGNSSSGSVNLDLAYGTAFIKRPKRKKSRYGDMRDARVPRRDGNLSEREMEAQRRPREKESRGNRPRPNPPGRFQSEAEMLEFGAKLAKAAAEQNRLDLMRSGSGTGRRPNASAYGRGEGTSRGLGPSKISHDAGAVDEEDWDTEPGSESEDSVDTRLAYGENKKGGGWSSFWKRKQRPLSRKDTVVDPRLFGPQNTLHGIVTEPVGFGEVSGWTSTSDFGQYPANAPGDSFSGSQASLVPVHPIQNAADPNDYEATTRSSVSGADQPYIQSRPGIIPLQAPQPITRVSQSVYDPGYSGRSDSGGISRKPSSSSGRQSLAEAALKGVTGPAGSAGVAAIISSRDERKEQREKEKRERQREEEEQERREIERLRRLDSERRDSERKEAERREREKRAKDDRRQRSSPDHEDRRDSRPRKERDKEEKEKEKEKEKKNSRYPTDEQPRESKRKPKREETQDGKDKRGQKPREERRGDRSDDYYEASVSTTKVDPFMYQVKDGSPPVPTEPVRKRDEPTVTVVTINREPDFSRVRSSSIKDQSSGSRSEPRNESWDEAEQQYWSRRERDRPLHEAESILHETEKFTAPIPGAAITAAFVAVHAAEEPRSEKTETGEKERDPIQEEADRVYREIVMARKIASKVIRSRSPSPDGSVVKKYTKDVEEEPIVRIVTPPGMEHHKEKGLYDAPNADFRLDHVLEDPQELQNFRITGIDFNPSRTSTPYLRMDPDASRPRPLLNLVRPTPVPSPMPEKQAARSQPKSEEPEQRTRSPEPDVIIGPKGDIISPTASTVSKAVTWGENVTKHYEVESPTEHKDDFIPNAEVEARETPKNPKPKSRGWGAITAGIIGAGAGAGAIAASSGDSSKTAQSKEKDNNKDTSFEYRGVVVEPEIPTPSPRRRRSPPSTDPRPSSPQSSRIPGAFGEDLEFTANVAAALQDNGFDPNIVINDPSFRRRDSPPGPSEAPSVYRAPFAETVTDLGTIPSSEISGARGRHEVTSVPQDRNTTSPPPEEYSVKLSKKDQKKREKESRRQSSDTTPTVPEPPTSRDLDQSDDYFEPKLSKKEQKKRDKEAKRQSSLVEDVASPAEHVLTEEVVQEPDSYYETPKKPKKKKKGSSSAYDDDVDESPQRKITVPIDEFDDLRNDDNDWAEPRKGTKKSKRDSDRYESPVRSAPPSEVASDLSRSSSKGTKNKSKRKSEQYDPDPTEISLPPSTNSEASRDEDYDESRDTGVPILRDSGIFNSADRGDVRSVVSEDASRYDDDEPRKSKKKSRSSTRDDYEDARSVASAPGDYSESKKSKKKEKERDKDKDKEKRSSGSFFGLFGSKSDSGAKDDSPKRTKDDFEDSKRSKKSKRSSVPDASSVYDDFEVEDEGRKDGEKRKTRTRSESASSKKDSFLDNAGILGAGAGIAGTAVAIAAQQYRQSKAANADSSETAEQIHSQESDKSLHDEGPLDPEIVQQRQFRPSIDPQYGDLLPLPPSNPESPNVEPLDDLPQLPDSRPDTPEIDRVSREKPMSSARKSLQDPPIKSPSQSAVPLNFLMRNRSTPSSPGAARFSPLTSPATPGHENLPFQRSRQSRPSSWDSSKEYRLLYLVETTRRESIAQANEPEIALPALPPSQRTSRSSSNLDFQDAEEYHSVNPLSIDTVLASSKGIGEFLDSQQSTPKVGPVPHDDDEVAESELDVRHREMSFSPSHSPDRPSTPIREDEHGSFGEDAAKVVAAAGIVSAVGYLASTPNHPETKEAEVDGLPPIRRQPSPVESTSKDRSSYLLRSSPMSKKSEDVVSTDLPAGDSKPDSADRDALHSIQERDGNDIFGAAEDLPKDIEQDRGRTLEALSGFPTIAATDEMSRDILENEQIPDDKQPEPIVPTGDEEEERPDAFVFTESKKDRKNKKGKGKGKGRSRSSTQDDVSLPEPSKDDVRDIPDPVEPESIVPTGDEEVERPDEFDFIESKKDRKNRKKGKGKGLSRTSTQDNISLPELSKDDSQETPDLAEPEPIVPPIDEEVERPDEFDFTESKKDRKNRKKGKGKGLSRTSTQDDISLPKPSKDDVREIPDLAEPAEPESIGPIVDEEVQRPDEFDFTESKKDRKNRKKGKGKGLSRTSTQDDMSLPEPSKDDVQDTPDLAELAEPDSIVPAGDEEVERPDKFDSTQDDYSLPEPSKDDVREIPGPAEPESIVPTGDEVERPDEFDFIESKKDRKNRKKGKGKGLSRTSTQDDISLPEPSKDDIRDIVDPVEPEPTEVVMNSGKNNKKGRKGKSASTRDAEVDQPEEGSKEKMPESLSLESPAPDNVNPIEEISGPTSEGDKKSSKSVPTGEPSSELPVDTLEEPVVETSRDLIVDAAIPPTVIANKYAELFVPKSKKDKKEDKSASTWDPTEGEQLEEPIAEPRREIAETMTSTATVEADDFLLTKLDIISKPASTRKPVKEPVTESSHPVLEHPPAIVENPESRSRELPETSQPSDSGLVSGEVPTIITEPEELVIPESISKDFSPEAVEESKRSKPGNAPAVESMAISALPESAPVPIARDAPLEIEDMPTSSGVPDAEPKSGREIFEDSNAPEEYVLTTTRKTKKKRGKSVPALEPEAEPVADQPTPEDDNVKNYEAFTPQRAKKNGKKSQSLVAEDLAPVLPEETIRNADAPDDNIQPANNLELGDKPSLSRQGSKKGNKKTKKSQGRNLVPGSSQDQSFTVEADNSLESDPIQERAVPEMPASKSMPIEAAALLLPIAAAGDMALDQPSHNESVSESATVSKLPDADVSSKSVPDGLASGYRDDQLNFARQLQEEFAKGNKKPKGDKKKRQSLPSTPDVDPSRSRTVEELSQEHPRARSLSIGPASHRVSFSPSTGEGGNVYSEEQLELARQLKAEFGSKSKQSKNNTKKRQSKRDDAPFEEAEEIQIRDSHDADERPEIPDPKGDGFAAGYQEEQLSLARQLQAEFSSGPKESKKGRRDKKRRSTSQTPQEQESRDDYFGEISQPLLSDSVQDEPAVTEPGLVDNETSRDGFAVGYNEEQLELARQLKEEFSSGSGSNSKKSKKREKAKRQSLLRSNTEDNFSSDALARDNADVDLETSAPEIADAGLVQPEDELVDFTNKPKKVKKSKKRDSIVQEIPDDVENLQSREILDDPVPPNPEEEVANFSTKPKKTKGKKRSSLLPSADDDDAIPENPKHVDESKADSLAREEPMDQDPNEPAVIQNNDDYTLAKKSKNSKKAQKGKKRDSSVPSAPEDPPTDDFDTQIRALHDASFSASKDIQAEPGESVPTPVGDDVEYSMKGKKTKKKRKGVAAQEETRDQPNSEDRSLEPAAEKGPLILDVIAADAIAEGLDQPTGEFKSTPKKKSEEQTRQSLLRSTSDSASEQKPQEKEHEYEHEHESETRDVDTQDAIPESELDNPPIPEDNILAEQTEEAPENFFGDFKFNKKSRKVKKKRNDSTKDDSEDVSGFSTPLEPLSEPKDTAGPSAPAEFPTEGILTAEKSTERGQDESIAPVTQEDGEERVDEWASFPTKKPKKEKKRKGSSKTGSGASTPLPIVEPTVADIQPLIPTERVLEKAPADGEPTSESQEGVPPPSLEQPVDDPMDEHAISTNESKKGKRSRKNSSKNDSGVSTPLLSISERAAEVALPIAAADALLAKIPENKELLREEHLREEPDDSIAVATREIAEDPVNPTLSTEVVADTGLAKEEPVEVTAPAIQEPAGETIDKGTFSSTISQNDTKKRKDSSRAELKEPSSVSTIMPEDVTEKTSRSEDPISLEPEDLTVSSAKDTAVELDDEWGSATTRMLEEDQKKGKSVTPALTDEPSKLEVSNLEEHDKQITDSKSPVPDVPNIQNDEDSSKAIGKEDVQETRDLEPENKEVENTVVEVQGAELPGTPPESSELFTKKPKKVKKSKRGSRATSGSEPSISAASDAPVAVKDFAETDTPSTAQRLVYSPTPFEEKDSSLMNEVVEPVLEPTQPLTEAPEVPPSDLSRTSSKKEKRKRQATVMDLGAAEDPGHARAPLTSWADDVEEAEVERELPVIDDIAIDESLSHIASTTESNPVDSSVRPVKKVKKGKKRYPMPNEPISSTDDSSRSTPGYDKPKEEPTGEHSIIPGLAAAGVTLAGAALLSSSSQTPDVKPRKELSKKQQRKISIDKRSNSRSDIFDDPELWEGAKPRAHEETKDYLEDSADDGISSTREMHEHMQTPEEVEVKHLVGHGRASQDEPMRGKSPQSTPLITRPSFTRELDNDQDNDLPHQQSEMPPQSHITSNPEHLEPRNLPTEDARGSEPADNLKPTSGDEKEKQNPLGSTWSWNIEEEPDVLTISQPISEPQRNIVNAPLASKGVSFDEVPPISREHISTPPTDRSLSPEELSEPSISRPVSRHRHSRLSDLPVVHEESEHHQEHHGPVDFNRDSAFVTGSPIPTQRGFDDTHEHVRDSGVHLRDLSPAEKGRAPVSSTDDAIARLSWPVVDEERETIDLHRPQGPLVATELKHHHKERSSPEPYNSKQSRDGPIDLFKSQRYTEERTRHHDEGTSNRDLLPSQKVEEKHTDLHRVPTIHGVRQSRDDSLVKQRMQRFESPDLPPPQKPREEGIARKRVQTMDDTDFQRSQPKEDKYPELASLSRPRAERPKGDIEAGVPIAGASLGFAAARKLSQEQRPGSAQSLRSQSNVNRLRTPEPKRPDSVGSNRHASATPPLRRSDRKISGDLRSLSQQSKPDLAKEAAGLAAVGLTAVAGAALASSVVNTANPTANEGRVRAKDMADVYDGFGEGRMGSPRSPTRPHSMRRRQSMQVLDLESKVEQLMAENRMLAEAKAEAERTLQSGQHPTSSLVEKDAEIDSLKRTLDWLQNEVTRLTEVNEGMNSANAQLARQHTEQYNMLQTQHGQATRELEEVRNAHTNLSSGMDGIVKNEVQTALQEKDEEIAQLRSELDAAKEQIRAMQRQILAAKASEAEFLTIRDEDYFDNCCQQLCQHVQQWVLRFSKFSDMRACRLTSEINNDKTIDRLDNAILDGSDVDTYLADRVKRRDVFMSMTMTMIWEFIFTRYLFGMDREQRQKLKSLEKTLSEVGPAAAVHAWRATTLTLLAKREVFAQQREQDTQAVVHAIIETLSEILPPPSHLESQIEEQLSRVIKAAVDLSIEMRTQRAEYMMLPPLQPEYDANGDLASKVSFNAALMNERSGDTVSNEDLEAQKAVVRVVLFPLVVKKGDDRGEGDEEIVVCPAQVLVAKPKKSVRVFSPESMVQDNRSRVSMQSTLPADYGEGSII